MFGGLKNFLGRLFGGDDDEEDKKKKPQKQASRPRRAQTQREAIDAVAPGVVEPQRPEKAVGRPDSGIDLYIPGARPQKANPVDLRNQRQKELDEATARNLPAAVENEATQTSWLQRNVTDRGWKQRAEIAARNQAARQVQGEGDIDQTISAFNRGTVRKAGTQADAARRGVERLQKVQKVAETGAQAIQYAPIAGSVLNLGLAGGERLAKAVGNETAQEDISRARNKIDFGLSEEDYNNLDDGTKAKLQNIRNIGLAATPLDFTGFSGLAKATGVQTLKKGVTQLAKQGTVDAATRAAIKQGVASTARSLAAPTVVGTALSAGGQQYLTGDVDPLAAVKGGLMVGGTSMLFPGRNLKKAALAGSVDDGSQVAPGVRSINPNRESDAAAQAAADVAKQAETARLRAEAQDLNVPAYMRKPAKAALVKADADARQAAVAADDVAAKELGVGESALDRPAFQHKQDIQQAIDAGRTELDEFTRTNPDASSEAIAAVKADIDQRVTTRIEQLQSARAGETPPAAAAVQPVDAAASPGVAPAAEDVLPDTAAPARTEPTVADLATGDRPENTLQTAIEEAHNAGDDVKAAELISQLPEDMQGPMRSALSIPESGSDAQTVDVAPRSHDALVKQLGPAAQGSKGQYSKRAPLNIEDLKTKAAGVIANIDDDTLVKSFASASPETMITDSQSFALARAAVGRLSQNADDPVNVQTVSNILDSMDRYVSKSGEGLRIVQEEFDNMPIPMKVRYIVKKIDSANADSPNYQRLADDPAKASRVEGIINDYLQGSQSINERVSAIEGQLNAVADAAMRGETVNANRGVLIKSLKDERRALAENNGELAKYYQTLIPGRSKGQRALSDFPRQMMLASFAGRVNDLLTTGSNIAELTARNITQGVLAKAINLFKPGKVTDTFRGGKQFFQGSAEGVRQGVGEFGGKQYAGDLQKALNSNIDARSGLYKARGPIGRTVQAATEFATKASEGVRDQRLYQLAVQEGQQAGLKGNVLTQYAEARAAVPSRKMLDMANQLHLETNNLNDNPVTRGLNRVAASIESQGPLAGLVKNQILPFTSWLGGNIWNSVTDKNVVASTIKFARDGLRGDTEGAVRNLAATINGAAQAYALGYSLTKAGLLTNENAEGYNDDGAYFHIGDRYIPVGFLGFFAPNIILGNAAYNGMNNPEGGSPSERIVDSAWQALSNLGKSINFQNALGADNNIIRAVQAGQRPGGDIQDAAATLGAGAAGQFIPAVGGDINALLNNGLTLGGVEIVPDTLNPTHEKADTKVVNPESKSGTARDVPKSALAGLQNRIPVLSQQLPRKAGVAAPDMVDRVTRGSHDTAEGKEAKAEAKAKVDRKADFEKRGIPNPEEKGFDDAVKSRIEDGKYDAAIEGLKAKVEMNKSDKDTPQSKSRELERQIKVLEVTRDGKFKPDIIELYKKTNLTEWRNMGDPESDDYDPDTYELLYEYDTKLADAKVSRNNTKSDKNFYFAKELKEKVGRRGKSDAEKARDRELKTIRGNTIGSTPELSKISLGDLAPQKVSAKVPIVEKIKSADLVKKRKISVGRA